VIFLKAAKCSRNCLISAFTWCSGTGNTIDSLVSSSTSTGAPLAGAFLSCLPFGGAFPFTAPAFSSWSFLRTLSLFSDKIATSSSVSSSPLFDFYLIKNFYLEALAFSARPGSSASQDALSSFSRSSLSVSWISANVSDE
jgi:hypothetical protein